MKKFSLKRAMAFGLATLCGVTVTACAVRESKKDLSDDATSLAQNDYLSNFNFDPNAPIAVPIQEVVMEDGTVGYKYPIYYMPYLVDKSKPFPGMSGVLEINDEYEIVSGSHVVYEDGSEKNLDFTGAVAIYLPYYAEIENKYNNILGENSSYTSKLTPVIDSDVFPTSYSLSQDYQLYTPDVSKQDQSFGYVEVGDNILYGMDPQDAINYVGITDTGRDLLMKADYYEKVAQEVYYDYNHTYSDYNGVIYSR